MTVVAAVQIFNQFLLEVFRGVKLPEIERFAIEQAKGAFYHGMIRAVSLPAHTLNNSKVSQLLLAVSVLVWPALFGVKDGRCLGAAGARQRRACL